MHVLIVFIWERKPATFRDSSLFCSVVQDCQRLCLQKAIQERCGCSIDVNDFVRDTGYDDSMYEYEESEATESSDNYPKPCDGSNGKYALKYPFIRL